jgi:hypothetical protein
MEGNSGAITNWNYLPDNPFPYKVEIELEKAFIKYKAEKVYISVFPGKTPPLPSGERKEVRGTNPS